MLLLYLYVFRLRIPCPGRLFNTSMYSYIPSLVLTICSIVASTHHPPYHPSRPSSSITLYGILIHTSVHYPSDHDEIFTTAYECVPGNISIVVLYGTPFLLAFVVFITALLIRLPSVSPMLSSLYEYVFSLFSHYLSLPSVFNPPSMCDIPRNAFPRMLRVLVREFESSRVARFWIYLQQKKKKINC